MDEVKVIINGIGGVGSGIVRVLSKRKGVKIAAAIDIDPEKIGKDAGVVAGIDPIGVIIEPDLRTACEREKADVAINVASSAEANVTFEQMIPAIDNGINVIVANSATVCLRQGEEKLAERVDAYCKEHGVSYLGMGNTQTTQRLILALAEGCSDIKSIKFTHFADVHAFSPESNANQLGITLNYDEYQRRIASGKPALVKWRSDVCYGIAHKMGWKLDRVDMEKELKVDDNNMIYANVSSFKGYVGDEAKIIMDWVFILDPERKYYDRVEIDGTPHVDSINNFSPDRGKASTFSSICNALPVVIKAAPGYVPTYDVEASTPEEGDDYRDRL